MWSRIGRALCVGELKFAPTFQLAPRGAGRSGEGGLAGLKPGAYIVSPRFRQPAWVPRTLERRIGAVDSAVALAISCLLQEFVGVADWDGQVGAAEAFQDGEIDADYFAAAIEEWAAGAAGRGGRVVNDFVL
jgi:hypothetical protein